MVAYQVMIKPCGPTCNLNCKYCFYLSKTKMFAEGSLRMSDETLETFTRQYIESHDSKHLTFSWQGGEPTLMGVDFFQKALELQKKYKRPEMIIENTLQTNGVLLDERWCRFLHDNKFLVGLSVDGPSSLHDAYRVDKKGNPTCSKVLEASKLLRKHKVEFNTLTVVNRINAHRPLQVYKFLRNVIGSRYMQFIPCVEPKGFAETPPLHWDDSVLPSMTDLKALPGSDGSKVTEWSVLPEDYGTFLTTVFDQWITTDVGRVFVINFEVAVGTWMGFPPSACVFARTCGNALALEHDGSLYSCDHFVYPEYLLGNLRESKISSMISSETQAKFGRWKNEALPPYCRECKFLFACHGECPKNRFLRTPDGDPGLNYLCKGLKHFFSHIDPWVRIIAEEIRAGRRAENVMPLARKSFSSSDVANLGR